MLLSAYEKPTLRRGRIVSLDGLWIHVNGVQAGDRMRHHLLGKNRLVDLEGCPGSSCRAAP